MKLPKHLSFIIVLNFFSPIYGQFNDTHFNELKEVVISPDYFVYANDAGKLNDLNDSSLSKTYTATTSIFIIPSLGYIEESQVICEYTTPDNLKLISTPLVNNLKYTWQYAPETSSTTFTDLNESDKELSFDDPSKPQFPKETTYYRVKVSNVTATTSITYTNVISITVLSPSVELKYHGTGNAFCKGDTLLFTATASKSGNFSFYVNDIVVQQSTATSTQATFTLINVNQDIVLTLLFENINGCSTTRSMTLSFYEFEAGEIGGPTDACPNNQNILLSSLSSGSVNGKALYGNDYIYQWQSSLDGSLYTDILNANTIEYTISTLTTDTHFKRLLRSTIPGIDCEESSNSIKISVSNVNTPTSSIQVTATLCSKSINASYSGGIAPYKGELYDNNQNLIGSASTVNSQTFNNLLPGRVYTLRISDSCFGSKDYVFEVPLEINLDPQKVFIRHDLCQEQPNDKGLGRISIAADAFSGGSNEFDYSWTGPSNYSGEGTEISSLLSGIYLLTVTDKKWGCTQTKSFIVLGKDPLNITLKTTNLSLDSNGIYQLNCQEDSPASVDVNVSGGHDNYTYSWKKDGELIPGNQTKLLNSVSAGTYEVTVTDVPPIGLDIRNPCQTVLSFKVESPSPLTVKVDRTDLKTYYCNNTFFQVPITVAGGVSPYTITIEGHGSITTSQNSYTFSNVDPNKLNGKLKVRVVDRGNCSASVADIPFQTEEQYTFVSSTTNIDCQQGTIGSIQLVLNTTSTVNESLNLEWKGATLHFFDTWANGKGLLKDLKNPGKYTVTITNNRKCVVYSESFEINSVTEDQLSVSINEEKLTDTCNSANGGIKLELNGGFPPYSIVWEQRNQSNNWMSLPLYNNQAFITGLSSGIYRATVSDASSASAINSCSEKITTRQIKIQQQDFNIFNFSVSNSADLCNTNEEGQIQFQIKNTLSTSSDTTSYFYKIDGATVPPNQINVQANLIKISGISPGDHQLIVQTKSGSNGCSVSRDFSIENSSTPINFTGQLTYKSSTCNESLQILIKPEDISGGNPFKLGNPYAIEWIYWPIKNNTQTVSYTIFGWKISDAHPGTYQLTISDANGCQNDPSTPIIIEVEAQTEEPITVKGSLKSDTGENVKMLSGQCSNVVNGTIGVDVEGGVRPFEIQWFLYDPEKVVNGDSSNALTLLPQYNNRTLLNELEVGIYRLEIRATQTSCASGTSPYTFYTEDIEITPNPNLNLLSGPFVESTLCQGKPGRITIEIFDNNQGKLYFYYNGIRIQKEAYEQINNQTFTLIIDEPTEEGELEIVNEKGCSIKHKINLGLGEPEFSFTSPSFESTNNFLVGEEITFKNNSSNPYVKSEWLFGDYSNPLVLSRTATSSVVKYRYPVSGAYPVTLRIYNSQGCYKEIINVVLVGKGYSISLPNVFSPNNDGINDLFRPLFSGFREIEFRVFDSQGNQLYLETKKEPDNENIKGFELMGWDANNASQDLFYIYNIKGVLFDKTEIDRSGTFILIQ